MSIIVKHHHLCIPISDYLEQVADFTNPWDERAYQSFIQHHLYETLDEGIVGMVREHRDHEYVYLDAAIRYPLENQTLK
ncbi:hypothetical protein Desdi_2344 [Desulfitobacterium dichloroeliminans LMG P-21439]|uniref:Uncharacterized protein n=1 Tax=Desulfitobacterium dichloroeliminans (strain LMG P-21439 / DCA1) TaxID=871963 RepID=L0F7F1_DESDL|nr:hypothetical protein [Desulfitobacterium dichloroeliminans]AGA69769.1 hypothetical protein Desdi_2344 [Desulfitobacterium dichloroeliminans LMG P-21439]